MNLIEHFCISIRDKQGYHLLCCSWDGTVAYMEFTRDELGKPLSKQETVRAIFGGTLYPTRTGNRKMGRHFPVRENSWDFEQTGKLRENHTKFWETQGISDKSYLLSFSDI